MMSFTIPILLFSISKVVFEVGVSVKVDAASKSTSIVAAGVRAVAVPKNSAPSNPDFNCVYAILFFLQS